MATKTDDLPTRVKVTEDMWNLIASYGVHVPAFTRRIRTPYPLNMSGVMLSAESDPRMKRTNLTADKQESMLKHFLSDPTQPARIAVSGVRDSARLEYMIAWLMHAHIKAVGPSARPVWTHLSEYHRPLLESEIRYSFVAISGASAGMSQAWVERLVTLYTKFQGVTVAFAVTGANGLTFMDMRTGDNLTHVFNMEVPVTPGS